MPTHYQGWTGTSAQHAVWLCIHSFKHVLKLSASDLDSCCMQVTQALFFQTHWTPKQLCRCFCQQLHNHNSNSAADCCRQDASLQSVFIDRVLQPSTQRGGAVACYLLLVRPVTHHGDGQGRKGWLGPPNSAHLRRGWRSLCPYR